MLNIEGKENFIIRNSLFDIRYSKSVILISDQEPEAFKSSAGHRARLIGSARCPTLLIKLAFKALSMNL